MSNINLVILSGRLGSNPKEGTTPGGKLKSYFSMATNEYNSHTDAEDTTWHNVTVYGVNAKRALKLLSKGDFVTITGKLDSYKKLVKLVDPKTGELKDINLTRVEVIGLNVDFNYNSLKKVTTNQVIAEHSTPSFQSKSVNLETNNISIPKADLSFNNKLNNNFNTNSMPQAITPSHNFSSSNVGVINNLTPAESGDFDDDEIPF